MYRCPRSNVICFSDTIERLFNRVRNKDTLFLCGDFNIYLLKCDSHGGMKQFIDLMYSLGHYPLIKRTSIITTTSTTLIHNMFTSELECKYKTYKNKLTGILRSTKKQYTYFNSLLEGKRNDIAGTRKKLKNIMGTSHLGNHFPDHLVNNGVTTAGSNKKDVVNLFNNFFTKIGPESSKDITVPANVSIYDYLNNRNKHNLFLTPVNKEEII